ncbi:MAG: NfeD family protein [Tenericutes bacterium HGW-Tenericutes-6]|jgi:membrane protein implicated in regulation of membrane protease activity|nr:MAG: NfeD family protein [Tenericutes bacterium HGW-Tenericutes-6]
MQDYMIWFWLGLFVVALFAELVTSDMISIWFALAALPSFVLALAGAHLIWQVIVFIIIAFALLLFTRPVVKKYMKTNEIKTNSEALIGTEGICIKEITPDTIGRVKVRYMEWSAISKETISLNEKVRILDIEGAKLIVEKLT